MRFRNVPQRAARSLLLLGAVVLLTGCITVGQTFSPQSISLIKTDQTTDREILKVFGNPVRTGITEDGRREWTYAHYRASLFGAFEGRDLVLTFNSDGTVKSYSYHTTDPKEQIVYPR